MPEETLLGIEVTGMYIYLLLLLMHFFYTVVKSFVEIVQILFGIPGVNKFFSGWLSQDSLEKFFGCQRQRGKSSENPNSHDFCKNTQALRVINSLGMYLGVTVGEINIR